MVENDETAKIASEPTRAISTALAPAAARALAEADQRRKAAARPDAKPPEINGRGALEPVRYGDWEVRGLASDF